MSSSLSYFLSRTTSDESLVMRFPFASVSHPLLFTRLPSLSCFYFPFPSSFGLPFSRSKLPIRSKGLKLCLSKLKGNGISPLSSCLWWKTLYFLFLPETMLPYLSFKYPLSLTFQPSLSIKSPFSFVKRMMFPFSSLSNTPMIWCSLNVIELGSGF